MTVPFDDLVNVSTDDFKQAMRQAVASVTIVTTCSSAYGQFMGLTATAVTSVSADPPLLLCCLNTKTASADEVLKSGFFGVSILARQDQHIAETFASSDARETRFNRGTWIKGQTGAPLLETAVASFDCVLDDSVMKGSHRIIFGRVIATRINNLLPLVYSAGQFGSFQTG